MHLCSSTMIKHFHHTHFLPLDTLVRKKESAEATVSVVIPALNEAATIGPIITEIKKNLMERHPLVDECIVIAGKSSDNTEAVARNSGATVYPIDEIASDTSVRLGKGTALWKSLHVAKGDIIVSIDADITNFDSRFVYGLIGPLLDDQKLSFVKAFYERPLVFKDALLDNYGGRVTEILVRPFLSTFYPELARFRQPLSGEYSFRREIIMEIPFLSGYSIEIGTILYLYKYHGLDIFAQTDMGIRQHRNRPVEELGKMSFRILQFLIRFLKEDGTISLNREINTEMITGLQAEVNAFHTDEIVLPKLSNYRSM
ncbi:MAG: glucosyl-3-phosphoglycerate synthase [Chitinivibrionales bacterium]|nr:glucosyl-3-phosphoglycerate synthase [Chitinivibrionales bacterium]